MVELNGHRLGGTKIQVEEAKPREGETEAERLFRNRTNIIQDW